MAFPTLLNLLHVRPFDYCKVLDLFVIALAFLPEKLKGYFLWTRMQILESLAWLPGSSIYPLIQETSLEPQEAAQGDDHEPFSANADPIPGLSLEIRSPTSAFKIVPSSRAASDAPPQSMTVRKEPRIPEGLGEMEAVHGVMTHGRRVLEDFFHKVLKLAAVRLVDFKSKLDFHPCHSTSILLQVTLLLGQ